MKISKLMAALLLPCASLAFAAPVKYIIIDHSTAPWMDQASAEAIWLKAPTAKFVKLFPAKKWGFLSQVEGGIDANKTCVITARTLMLPVKGKDLLFKPAKSATTFGSQANASVEQCKALASAKLDEAVQALGSALIPN
ncbi:MULTISPECIES: hypothetical protein [Roseateles]|uniref:Uncharacterized protein n=1 Tax=Roseateles albus TaxID=2987525 RepID=A0ABT5KBM5_9BURK|nr:MULTISPECIES: hypothetical protein [Roseateles]MCV2358791.1 hypothetical protein [Paucibacter sp. TC2R-5]MDC8771337.1 hypothetical protein [Roseateles albus]